MRSGMSDSYIGEPPRSHIKFDEILRRRELRNVEVNVKRGSKDRNFPENTYVCVKLPNGEKSAPMKVLRDFRTFSILSDNKKWSHNRITKFQPERGNVG